MSDPQNHFMARAIELSLENVRSGRGGPFAAVVVKHGKVIAEGVNQVTLLNDPTGHAEVIAIRAACKQMENFELRDCELYCSCEPCPMCLGAIYWARLARVYFANTEQDAAEIGFDDSFIYREITKHFSQRNIPMAQMMREQALAAFQAWRDKPDKKMY